MADEIDIAQDFEQKMKDKEINRIRSKSHLEPGFAGGCEMCGEWSSRLVNGVCAPCRDKYKLP